LQLHSINVKSNHWGQTKKRCSKDVGSEGRRGTLATRLNGTVGIYAAMETGKKTKATHKKAYDGSGSTTAKCQKGGNGARRAGVKPGEKIRADK